jgi:hypothetical protein
MKNKKIPMRTCIISKEKLPKKELIRIVKSNENIVSVDLTGKSNGHGAYIKKNLEILDKAIKTKLLDKYLEITIPDSIYDELRNIINNK